MYAKNGQSAVWLLSPFIAQQTLLVADATAMKTIFNDPVVYRKQMPFYS